METAQLKYNDQFIVRLLKQALIVYRLTDGLEKVGFHPEDVYDLEIADMVFDLMGYTHDGNSDWFFDCYVEYLSGLDGSKLADNDFLENAAINLYHRLNKTSHCMSISQ